MNKIRPPFASSVAIAVALLNILNRCFIVGLGRRDIIGEVFDIAKRKMKDVTNMRGQLYM